MVVFDLPEEKRGLRNELRKQLRAARFGGLQGSVWISPDPVDLIGEQLREAAVSCGVMTFFEGSTCGGESTPELVASAWNFERIHENHETYRTHLTQIPAPGDASLREKLLEWGRIEKSLWADCISGDPLLPRELWPMDYPGESAWKERTQALRLAGKLASKA